MANTITQITLKGGSSEKNVVRLIHIVSDGTEETDTIVFNNSDFINDASKGRVVGIKAVGDACNIRLEWDQTADSPIISLDPSTSIDWCFKSFGGIPNPNAAGATGDIVMTTADLDNGDEATLIIHIEQV